MHLTAKQFQQLKARWIGWPYNGYELQRMKEAGTFPPRLLSQAEEEAFLSQRKQ